MSAAWLERWLWPRRPALPDVPGTALVAVRDATLRVRQAGSGERLLVFLCDPPVTVELYDALIERLAPHHRVAVIELPGFGFSRAEATSGLGFDAAVDAVERAVAALGARDVVFCAPCVTGFVAVRIAQRGRLPVQGLALMQVPDFAGMRAWTERMDPKRRLRTPWLGQLLLRAVARRTVTFWMRYATARDYDASDDVKLILDAMKRGAAYPLASMLQDWTEGPQDGALELPVLALWGRQDRSHADTDPAVSRAHAREARIETVAHCGHFTELEDAAAFCDLLLPWLDTLTPAAAPSPR